MSPGRTVIQLESSLSQEMIKEPLVWKTSEQSNAGAVNETSTAVYKEGSVPRPPALLSAGTSNKSSLWSVGGGLPLTEEVHTLLVAPGRKDPLIIGRPVSTLSGCCASSPKLTFKLCRFASHL